MTRERWAAPTWRELAQDRRTANWDSMVMLGWTDWKTEEGVSQETRQKLSGLNENGASAEDSWAASSASDLVLLSL